MPRRPKDSPPRDPQQIIDELQQENERLREDMRRSEIERNRLRRENERLKEELEMARRRATRQAAPFSRRLPKEHPARPGRKAGAADGRKAHRRPPPHVDVTHDTPLPRSVRTAVGRSGTAASSRSITKRLLRAC